MLTKRFIPCLDVDDGRVVKGIRFQNLRDAGDPVELATRYEADGADELVLLDIGATPTGTSTALKTVSNVRAALSIPLTVGGGIRSAQNAKDALEAGADKVAVNTAAVTNPRLIEELAQTFGKQCTILALDAAARPGGWEVVVKSGRERTGLDAVAWASEAAAHGAGEILLTSWDRDGTRSGYDLDLIRAIAASTSVPIIASGGAAGPQHFVEAFEAGADAVLAAGIFHSGECAIASAKEYVAARGYPVRTGAST